MNPDATNHRKVTTESDIDELVRRAFFPDARCGVLIEIGAARPDFLSIGASFRERGWRVVGIEPNPAFADAHRIRGHEIYEYACGDADQDDVDFTIAEGHGLEYLGGKITAESFSSLGIRGPYQEFYSRLKDKFSLKTIKVRVRKLDTILQEIPALPRIDILALDVEGWELECLKGFSFGERSPRLIIVEDLFGDERLPRFLSERGYIRWRHLRPNSVYIDREFFQSEQDKMALVKPPMVSYTPNLEDVLLWRCFWNVEAGFYVDIGANHPTHASVTRWFYDCGWSGINVEPGEGIEALKSERPRDINLGMAVSDREGSATFWVHSANLGTSTLSADSPQVVLERAGEVKPIAVELTTLPLILDKYAPGRHIHFLKIDAEGAENAIVLASDWRRHRPEVIVIESTEPYTNKRRKEPWHEILATAAYQFAYFDGVNDFWVRDESKHLASAFEVPVNVLDNYRIFDPEVISLRSQLMAKGSALDLASAQMTELRQRLESARARLKARKRKKRLFWQRLRQIVRGAFRP